MGSKKTAEQVSMELSAVKAALRSGDWMRPIDVARAANIGLAAALASLMRLTEQHQAKRRAYTVPRIHVGHDRTRKTSREVVEYRIVIKRRPTWPDWLMPVFIPPKTASKTLHRLC